jgi:hypothetical protein
MEYDLDQSRLWFRDNLPVSKPTSFIAKRDVMILDNGDSFIWDGSWKSVTNPLKGKDGLNGRDGIDGINGIDGKDGKDGIDGTSGTGGANIGFVRWVTTAAELNSAWAGLANGSVRSIHLASDITLTQPLVIPSNYNRILEIDGHGAKITIPSTVPTGIKRAYPSLSEANAGIDCQLRITNVIFQGASRTNTAIDVQATYGSEIKGCRIYDFQTGIKSGWMMGTIIDQVYAWENYISLDLDYARFTGGSNSASQSNHTIVQNCKFRHSAGQFGAIKATAVSGLRIRGCIFEGIQNGSEYEVYFDDNGSTVVKDFEISNCHIEQQQQTAGIYIRLKDGFAYVNNVFSQYDCNLVKFESSGYAKCIVKGIPYLTAGTKFENVNGAGRWKFIDVPATFLITDATKWNGTPPVNSSIDGWQTNGQSNYLQGTTIK